MRLTKKQEEYSLELTEDQLFDFFHYLESIDFDFEMKHIKKSNEQYKDEKFAAGLINLADQRKQTVQQFLGLMFENFEI